MRKIIKTLLVVMALVLVVTAFTSCELVDKIKDMITPAPAECVHQGGAATCTEAAICELCGEPYGEALGHTAELISAVEPTCEGTGLTSGSKCKVCGEILEAQEEIPAKGHTAVTDAAVDATCSSTGLTEGSHCSVCDKVLVAQETTEKLAHTPVVDAAVEANCSSTGLTEGSHCSVCDEVIVAQEVVEALPHTFTFVTTLPTADAAGSTTATCSVCEHSVTFDSVNVMGEGTYVLDAADLAGIAQYSLYDGEVKVVNGLFECHLSAKYRTDDKTTEFSDGWFSTHRMNFGGKTEFKSNGMIKNGIVFTTAGDTTVKIWWVEGGDDSRQIALYNMNGEIVAQTEDVLSKNDPCVSVLTVPAGTYVLGNVVNTNYHFRVEVTVAAPHTHDYKAVVTAPTCTEAGYTTYTCDCGDSYVADEVAATGHAYVDGACTSCGAIDPDYSGEVVASKVTMTYTEGNPTTNMTGGNDAAKVGLDPNLFTVTSSKGSTSNHIGLNTGGTIRLYNHKSGNGNELTVTIAEGYKITSISFVFKATGRSNGYTITNGEGVLVHSVAANETVTSLELTVDGINSDTFVIKNIHTGSSKQFWIVSLEIEYEAE